VRKKNTHLERATVEISVHLIASMVFQREQRERDKEEGERMRKNGIETIVVDFGL
jgi:hypothetical protein